MGKINLIKYVKSKKIDDCVNKGEVMDQQKKAVKKELKRQQILDGALKVFCEKNVASTTVDDICNKVGCSHGLFYHYYKNKDELLTDLRKKWDFRFRFREKLSLL